MSSDTLLTLPKTSPFPTTITFDVLNGETQYVAPLSTAHSIVNFRGGPGTTLLSLLNNKMIICRLILRNGSRGFIPSTFFVDGQAHFPDFPSGSQRKTATANRMLELEFKFYTIGSTVHSLVSYNEYAPADKRAVAITAR